MALTRWTAGPNGQDRLHELLNTSLGEAWAHISPDGRLIAYVGWEADQRNVYAQAYPDLGPRIRVSGNGGGEPRWTRDSRSLYYRAAGIIFKADIEIEPELNVTTVKTLPIDDVYAAAGSGHQHYDLSLDGTNFLLVKHGRRVYPTSVHIIENCASELEQQFDTVMVLG